MERANLIQITLSRSLWLLWSVPFFPRRSAILVCVGLLFISISFFSLNVNIIGQRLSCFSLLAAYLYDWVGVSISSLVIEFFYLTQNYIYWLVFMFVLLWRKLATIRLGFCFGGIWKIKRYRVLITVAMNDFENEQYFLLHK